MTSVDKEGIGSDPQRYKNREIVYQRGLSEEEEESDGKVSPEDVDGGPSIQYELQSGDQSRL